MAMRSGIRDYGLHPGVLPPGPLNAITDVAGVRVGHLTRIEGSNTRTGATAILPHGGNLFQDRVPAGLHVANGHGKLAGATQLVELGELETPILLVNTLAVGRAVEAVVDWTLGQPGNEMVVSVNAVVGETNDSPLNNIRARGLVAGDVLAAIEAAAEGPVPQGAIGAGAGTIAYEWKGGIGTSSRLVPTVCGTYCVGVLVQANHGGVLTIDGLPVGRANGRYHLRDALDQSSADGSIMVVVATDAPLSDRNLTRLAARAMAGVARTGASFANGSGDYAIAFSTAFEVRRSASGRQSRLGGGELGNDAVSPLFLGAIEAAEEAVYNALATAVTTRATAAATNEVVSIPALDAEALDRARQAMRGVAEQ